MHVLICSKAYCWDDDDYDWWRPLSFSKQFWIPYYIRYNSSYTSLYVSTAIQLYKLPKTQPLHRSQSLLSILETLSNIYVRILFVVRKALKEKFIFTCKYRTCGMGCDDVTQTKRKAIAMLLLLCSYVCVKVQVVWKITELLYILPKDRRETFLLWVHGVSFCVYIYRFQFFVSISTIPIPLSFLCCLLLKGWEKIRYPYSSILHPPLLNRKNLWSAVIH